MSFTNDQNMKENKTLLNTDNIAFIATSDSIQICQLHAFNNTIFFMAYCAKIALHRVSWYKN